MQKEIICKILLVLFETNSIYILYLIDGNNSFALYDEYGPFYPI